MLILPQSYWLSEKHPKWQATTPNELRRSSLSYAETSTHFAKKAGFSGPWGFEEVRIVLPESQIELENPWWSDPLFMDKVFWVYRTPFYYEPDGVKWGIYLLEPFECQRVAAVAENKFGHPVFGKNAPIVIPIDVTQRAFYETSNGVSDHIRPLLRVEPSAEDKEKEAEDRAAIEARLVEVKEITNELWEGEKKNERLVRG
jgi:hypothetical protein